MIIFEDVTKIFGNRTAIRGLDFHMPKGEVVGLIGASGAGKTTLIKLACGLLEPTSGKVRTFRKEPIKNRKTISTRIGVLMANAQFFNKDDTVETCFEDMRTIYNLPFEQFKNDYDNLSQELDFDYLKKQPIKDLSLGQKMRVQLGGVLIHRPELLILDEPTIALDENAKLAFQNIIKEQVVNGTSVLITTHNMKEASNLSSRIALLNKGELVYYGSQNNLLRTYKPLDTMIIKFGGKLPDLQDLPLVQYSIDGQILTISYNTNHITAAEILELILEKSTVLSVNIKKPELSDVIQIEM